MRHCRSSRPSKREISLFSRDSYVRLTRLCTFEILLILFEPRSSFFRYFRLSRFWIPVSLFFSRLSSSSTLRFSRPSISEM